MKAAFLFIKGDNSLVNYELIQGKDNHLIKEINKLKDKKNREKYNEFIVEGFRFVKEACESSFTVKIILIDEEQKTKWHYFDMEDSVKANTKIFYVKTSIMKYLSYTETPQGILAVVENTIQDISSDKDGFYVLADKIQDPGNLGTIIRTANAGNALGVIITQGTVDLYNDKVLRATMGSVFKIPVIEDKNLELVSRLRNAGYKLYASSLDTDYSIYDVDLTEKIIIAIGNEGKGISDEIYSISDKKVKIPMPGNAESLNASSAAAVIVFEAVRQRLKK